MILATVPYARFDPGNALARDYLVRPEKALPLFGPDYRDPRALAPLVDAQGRRGRPALARALAAYNRDVGGSVENAERIDDAFCVVAGQQVGLLYGPAYTTYKLFTVVNAAKAIGEELGVPVVPVFWIESEDHDWAEVNRFFWGGERFGIEEEVPQGLPLSRVEVDPAPFLARVRGVLDGDDAAWALVAPERSVARWHARNLARLVEGAGVVFVEPALLREPMRPLAEEIAARADAIDASLARDTGYERRLEPPRGAYLFDAAAGRRRVARGAPVPERWSTDVVSRVLVQDAAFRVLAAVCGPAEIQYWAQLRGAHEAFGIPMPAVLPRDSATLVERGVARDAARIGLDLERAVCGDAAPPEPVAEDEVARRLRLLAGDAKDLADAVEGGAVELPPNAERPFRRTVGRLREDLERLAGRLDDARAEARGAGRRRYERVMAELRPRGKPQERTHSLFPYLVRHGPDLARRLRESFDPFEFGHYLVQL